MVLIGLVPERIQHFLEDLLGVGPVFEDTVYRRVEEPGISLVEAAKSLFVTGCDPGQHLSIGEVVIRADKVGGEFRFHDKKSLFWNKTPHNRNVDKSF